MDDLLKVIRDYYREKRIQRILTILQPDRYRSSSRRKQKTQFVARDSMFRFVLTLMAIPICALPFSILKSIKFQPLQFALGFISLVLAVELSDYVWMKSRKTFDYVMDYGVPLLFVGFVVFFVGIKLSGLGPQGGNFFSEFQKKMSANLAKPIPMTLPISGENWKFLVDKGALIQLKGADAQAQCAALGKGWGLPTIGILPVLKPSPQVPRQVYLWMNGIRSAASFDGTINSSPSAFVQGDPATTYHFVLCVKEDRGV